MSTAAPSFPSVNPALTRLAKLAPLRPEEIARLHGAFANARRVRPRSEIQREGEPIAGASILLSGWGCRQRILSDGRRQLLSLLLPGDLIGICRQRRPTAPTTVYALSEVILCPAPMPDRMDTESGLAEAYAVSGALDDVYLFRQITRLGRLSALERIVDWALEMRERLGLCDMISGTSFPAPVTQEVLADTLGLTPVHVNRTLKTLQRQGLMEMQGGRINLLNVSHLEALIDHRPAKVSH